MVPYYESGETLPIEKIFYRSGYFLFPFKNIFARFLQVSSLRTLRNMKPNSEGNSLATLTTSVELVIQYDVATLTFADLIQVELTFTPKKVICSPSLPFRTSKVN